MAGETLAALWTVASFDTSALVVANRDLVVEQQYFATAEVVDGWSVVG